MTTAPTPLRIADHPALDFLNSVVAEADGPRDWLAEPATARAWLAAADMPTELAADDLRRLRALREWLRGFLARPRIGVRPEDLEPLNAALALGRAHAAVRPDGQGRLVRVQARDLAPGDAAMLAAAEAIADLLTAADPADVRRCAGHGCLLWFHDRSRGRRRRWCAMSICGNRSKVAAHRARAREADQDA